MFDLKRFVAQCEEALTESDPAAVVESLVQAAIADPEGLRAAFAPTARGKTIADRCAYRSERLTVLDVTNSPALVTPAHDHQMWAVIGVYDGEEQNVFYEDQGEGGVERCGEQLLKKGDVAVLDKATIHAISNPLESKSCAIHVYGGDLVERTGRRVWHPETGVPEPYEINRLSAYVKDMMGRGASMP